MISIFDIRKHLQQQVGQSSLTCAHQIRAQFVLIQEIALKLGKFC